MPRCSRPGDAAAAAATCRAGVALFGPEVLPAAGEAEWARPHRVRLEEARLRLTEDELAARMQLGASGEVTGVLEALVAAHPLRERLWALLVTALYRAGRQSDALAAHRRVARLLAEELGVDPARSSPRWNGRCSTHDRALAPVARPSAESPVPASGRRASHLGNLPGLTAPLVGRTGEVAALVTALDAHRLVTVTGPAGVGKTRLAVEVARHVDAAHGTWLVRLDSGPAPGRASRPSSPTRFRSWTAAGRRRPGCAVPRRCSSSTTASTSSTASVRSSRACSTPRRDVRVLATSQRPLGLDGEVVHASAP